MLEPLNQLPSTWKQDAQTGGVQQVALCPVVRKCRLQGIDPFHFAQHDPGKDSALPEFGWGCAQPSNESRAVPMGASLTLTATVLMSQALS